MMGAGGSAGGMDCPSAFNRRSSPTVLLWMYCREIAPFEGRRAYRSRNQHPLRAVVMSYSIHLVGGDEQLVGHSEAEHPGGLDVDDQLELGWASDLMASTILSVTIS